MKNPVEEFMARGLDSLKEQYHEEWMTALYSKDEQVQVAFMAKWHPGWTQVPGEPGVWSPPHE